MHNYQCSAPRLEAIAAGVVKADGGSDRPTRIAAVVSVTVFATSFVMARASYLPSCGWLVKRMPGLAVIGLLS
jgi:hypothetical protein